ncbi:MBL fold metallo-hydrolase [Paracoccus albus]|uniref:MBL fold metallo-hydrolase n=1 Tax=Paracoccus albus TaxID=3017784 RepID=UPI0022F104B3|nr:MBL fold metallo-hydrolase [Paracoccus albus]WBU61618.1 MBL fold metallo-hydrolase [Paracoccus albus]
MRLSEQPLERPLREVLAQPPGEGLRLFWLGQAGFVIDGAGRRVVIDPYLSNSLAEKYRGKKFPHTRLMPAPVAADKVAHVDLVIATHAHSDHLDPGTLPALMGANPLARLIAPASASEVAVERARIVPERLIAIDAGETISHRGIKITATRAAHETIETDEAGRHRFLGMAIGIAGRVVYHSGDTVPFEDQTAEVASLNADLALFPVNGRDDLRAGNGVPGNMTLDEAISLARAAGIGTVIAHHFDMFEFNTLPRDTVERAAAASQNPQLLAAQINLSYVPAPETIERTS